MLSLATGLITAIAALITAVVAVAGVWINRPRKPSTAASDSNGPAILRSDVAITRRAPRRRWLVILWVSVVAVMAGSLIVFMKLRHTPTGRQPGSLASTPASPTPSIQSEPTIKEYAVPSPNAGLVSIATGPDGNLWFTEQSADKVGRINPDGSGVKEFSLPAHSVPADIFAGPDGHMWVLENAAGGSTRPQAIARVAMDGTVTHIALPTGRNVVSIAAGPDGNVWFTEYATNQVGRMNQSGKITGEFTIPTPNSGAAEITAGPDGNMWFDQQNGHQIAKVTMSGQITEYRYTGVVVPDTQNNHNPTAGPDGNVWFTDFWNNMIGKVSPSGTVTEYPGRTEGELPLGIVAGQDGALWFTECIPDAARERCASGSKIGRCTVDGQITEFPLPDPVSGADGITVGPDHAIWFTEGQAGKIGRIAIS